MAAEEDSNPSITLACIIAYDRSFSAFYKTKCNGGKKPQTQAECGLEPDQDSTKAHNTFRRTLFTYCIEVSPRHDSSLTPKCAEDLFWTSSIALQNAGELCPIYSTGAWQSISRVNKESAAPCLAAILKIHRRAARSHRRTKVESCKPKK